MEKMCSPEGDGHTWAHFIQPANIQPANIQPANVQPANVQSANIQPKKSSGTLA
jgi:hypothetical protein